MNRPMEAIILAPRSIMSLYRLLLPVALKNPPGHCPLFSLPETEQLTISGSAALDYGITAGI